MNWIIRIALIVIAVILITTAVIKIYGMKSPDIGLRSPLPPSLSDQKLRILPQLPAYSIPEMRKKTYPGSIITIEQTLSPGINYSRYIASYYSEGNKIYGLLTVPGGNQPDGGFPAIVFIHGHLDPKTYNTTERYVAYQDGFARNGFITFKPDLRGHGNSGGQPVNSNFSDGYVTDTLVLASSLQKFTGVNPQRLGVWGHSMGGGIALKDMVVSKVFKAGVIWAGVVGNYSDIVERYRSRSSWLTSLSQSSTVSALLTQYGSPSASSPFWLSIDPYTYLSDISGPIQLDHGTADESVPPEFSQHLYAALKAAGKTAEYFSYPGSDHNIAQGFSQAMDHSVAFFKKNL